MSLSFFVSFKNTITKQKPYVEPTVTLQRILKPWKMVSWFFVGNEDKRSSWWKEMIRYELILKKIFFGSLKTQQQTRKIMCRAPYRDPPKDIEDILMISWFGLCNNQRQSKSMSIWWCFCSSYCHSVNEMQWVIVWVLSFRVTIV